MKRAMAAAMIAALGVACGGDMTDPDDPVVALSAGDSLVLDAVRDSVHLRVELVHRSGLTEVAAADSWRGCGGAVGTLSPDGVLYTEAPGECRAIAAWGGMEDSTRIVVRRRGVLTITFDDGWKTARTVALPVLRDAGLLGNVAVVPGTAGWPAFLTVDEMRELHDAGWAFVSHTMTHDSLPSVLDDSLAWQIEQPVRWLRQAGLRTGNVFIVPYHAWGAREEAVLRSTFAAVRGHGLASFEPGHMAEWRPADPYHLTAIDGSALARTAEGRAEALSHVERAVAEGLMLDIQFHDIEPEEEAGFRELIDGIAAHADRVRTWSDLFPTGS